MKKNLYYGHHKRDLRELATKEISEKLGIALGDIKAKLNSLRAQLGNNMFKTSYG